MTLLLDAPAQSQILLREYQHKVIDDLYNQIRQGKNKTVLVAPTGAGKTVISAQIVKHARLKNRRVLFVVHLDVLVRQTFDKMRYLGITDDIGFIKAGFDELKSAPIQIASIQSMGRRNWWKIEEFDVIILDECHQTAFSQIGQELLYQTHPNSKYIGLTATPYRLKKNEGLGDHFEAMVSTPTPSQLQELGHLAELKYFGLPKPDLSGVKTVRGDYDQEGLKNACDRPELITRAVEEWKRLTPGKRTIAFCVDVGHALHLAQAFRDAGVIAETVTGDTPIPDRTRMYQSLRDGSLQVLTSVNVVSIGFDEPSVEVGLMCRPTKSKAMHHQQIGRIMRTSPGKEFGTILDQSGNCLRLGFPEDIDNYELKTSREKEDKEAPKKECPCCQAILYTFIKICPNCGHEFVGEVVTETRELVEIKIARSQQKQIKAYQKLKRTAYRLGFNPAWAYHQFKSQFKTEPRREWANGAIFGDTPDESDFEMYFQILVDLSERKSKDMTWVQREWTAEFGRKNNNWLLRRMVRK